MAIFCMPRRTMPTSVARARLGAVIDSLPSSGPVDITRNGHRVATLVPFPDPDTPPKDLAQLARLFAEGSITSRQACEESGVTFGDVLNEMANQGLKLPLHQAVKTPAQEALFKAMLDHGVKAL